MDDKSTADKPLVSVVIPAYNAQATIGRTLDSLIRQTYDNIMIIVVVEYGCADDTLKVCRQYAQSDSRIFTVQNSKNLGMPLSTNRGLELATGKYIAKVDADDVCSLNKIEKQVLFMEAHPNVGVCGTQLTEIDENSGSATCSNYPTDTDELKCICLFNMPMGHPTVMFRAETLAKYGFRYPNRITEDYALFSAMSDFMDFAVLPEELLEYHVAGSNATSVRFEAIRDDSAQISKEYIKKSLGVDTGAYDDSYFGWRKYESINIDSIEYIMKGADLLREKRSRKQSR